MPTTGLAYPLQFDGNGGLKTSTDSENCRDHIISWLETVVGERLGLPEYGTEDYLLSSYQNFGTVTTEISNRLSEAIPEALVSVTGDINGDGEALLTVEWTYQGSSQPTIVLSMELPSNYGSPISDSGNIGYLPKLFWVDTSQEKFDAGQSVSVLKDFARPGVLWTSSTGTRPLFNVDNLGRKAIVSTLAAATYLASAPAVFAASSPFLMWLVVNISDSGSSIFGRSGNPQRFVFQNNPYYVFAGGIAPTYNSQIVGKWEVILIYRLANNYIGVNANGVESVCISGSPYYGSDFGADQLNAALGSGCTGSIAEFGGMVGSYSDAQKIAFTNFLRQKWQF